MKHCCVGAQIAGSARAAPAAEAEEYFHDGDERVEKIAPPIDPKGLPRGARRFSEKYQEADSSSTPVRPHPCLQPLVPLYIPYVPMQ